MLVNFAPLVDARKVSSIGTNLAGTTVFGFHHSDGAKRFDDTGDSRYRALNNPRLAGLSCKSGNRIDYLTATYREVCSRSPPTSVDIGHGGPGGERFRWLDLSINTLYHVDLWICDGGKGRDHVCQAVFWTKKAWDLANKNLQYDVSDLLVCGTDLNAEHLDPPAPDWIRYQWTSDRGEVIQSFKGWWNKEIEMIEIVLGKAPLKGACKWGS